MDNSDSIRIALIPAYDPVSLFSNVLRGVKDKGFQIVVVNDGSSEEKNELFLEAKKYAHVLKHEKNRGKGRAIKTGMEYIKLHFPPDCTVVTMDADGQHTAEDAVKVTTDAEQNPNALILGSRKFTGNVPLRSLFGNTITRLIYRLSTGLCVYDTQTGLRAFNAALIPTLLNIRGERFEYEMNVLLELSRKNIPITETPIETIYIEENKSSHFDTVKDSYRIYKEILKFSASSLLSFAVDYFFYTLFSLFGASVTLSNISARIISACFNYTMNKNLVFKSDVSVVKSALQYFLLAAAILLGNTLVLNLLANTFGVNRYAAKLFTEIIFFAVSWLVQKKLIFKRSAERK